MLAHIRFLWTDAPGILVLCAFQLCIVAFGAASCTLTPAQSAALTTGAADLASAAACDLLPLATSELPAALQSVAKEGDVLACEEAKPAVRVALSAALNSSPAPVATSAAKRAVRDKSGRTVAVVPAHLHAGVSAALAK